MRRSIMLLACGLCLACTALGQGTLRGKLIDAASKAAVGLATVTVFKASDTAIITYRLSSPDGEFKVPGLPLDHSAENQSDNYCGLPARARRAPNPISAAANVQRCTVCITGCLSIQ